MQLYPGTSRPTEPPTRKLRSAPIIDNEQRARLLDAAANVIARRGVAGATVDEIVAHASVSRRTFYREFRGVAHALEACYERALASQYAAMTNATSSPEDPIGDCIGAFLSTIASDPDGARVTLIEYRLAGPSFDARYHRDSMRLARLLYTRLAAAQRSRGPTLVPLRMASFTLAKGIEAYAIRALLRGTHAELPNAALDLTQLVLAVVRR